MILQYYIINFHKIFNKYFAGIKKSSTFVPAFDDKSMFIEL
jgi:hypothetical protein